LRISLIVTTYERPDALAAVLRSVVRQTRRPDEVLIGDDGSGQETAEVINSFADKLIIVHEWREHKGFQVSRMRNCCLSRATGDYVVMIDGDLLLHPKFLADHESAARVGYFVQGKRILLDEAATRLALEAETYWPSIWDKGLERRRHVLRLPWLTRLFQNARHLRGIRGCNFAFWLADAKRVNGYNEDFVGWGREDDEFALRLWNSGIRRLNLRFAGLGCHLYHPPRDLEKLAANDRLLEEARMRKATWCEKGLDGYGAH
jgi:glycosyltransferase involved in cell wall biosynthesis